MATKRTVHICSFTVGIDELPLKQQSNLRAVLTILAETKCFSVFEATANQTIAATMDKIGRHGYIKSVGGSYPWCEIEITEKGQALLDEALRAEGAAEKKERVD